MGWSDLANLLFALQKNCRRSPTVLSDVRASDQGAAAQGIALAGKNPERSGRGGAPVCGQATGVERLISAGKSRRESAVRRPRICAPGQRQSRARATEGGREGRLFRVLARGSVNPSPSGEGSSPRCGRATIDGATAGNQLNLLCKRGPFGPFPCTLANRHLAYLCRESRRIAQSHVEQALPVLPPGHRRAPAPCQCPVL